MDSFIIIVLSVANRKWCLACFKHSLTSCPLVKLTNENHLKTLDLPNLFFEELYLYSVVERNSKQELLDTFIWHQIARSSFESSK